jgi:hypothetical protein
MDVETIARGLTARWPALLDRKALAEYLSCSLPSLDREIARCNIPPPIRFAGRDKWRKDDIDLALAALTGEGLAPWRARHMRGDKAA